MSIKKLFLVFVGALLIETASAKPPFEVLRSCIDELPKTSDVHITNIDNGFFLENPDKNCEEQFELTFDEKHYGAVRCNQRPYLIIANKRVGLEQVENGSINPEVKPGMVYSTDSSWLKIDFKHSSYLCINGPISRSGVGSDIGQYYLVENAFAENTAPKIYYYFFNQDVIPITSEHF